MLSLKAKATKAPAWPPRDGRGTPVALTRAAAFRDRKLDHGAAPGTDSALQAVEVQSVDPKDGAKPAPKDAKPAVATGGRKALMF